jgi:TPR repeat protein
MLLDMNNQRKVSAVLAILFISFPFVACSEMTECNDLAKVVMEGVWKNNLTLENYQIAKTVCEKQALEGIPEAQYHLGGLYTVHFGEIYPNESEMWKWMQISAENGYAKSQGFLGRSYETDKNYLRKKDTGLALKWHTLAAEQHDIASMVRLEEIYRTGLLGVKADIEKADYWANQLEK